MRHIRACIKISTAYLLAASWIAFAILALINDGGIIVRGSAVFAPLASALVIAKTWPEPKVMNLVINAPPALLWLAFCDKHTPLATGMIFLLSLLLLAFGLIENLATYSKSHTGKAI